MDPATRLRQLHDALQPHREALLAHPIYEQIDRLENLQLFMQSHVFAVWDFMSLLKALQHCICSSEVPWTPSSNPSAVRLVNEIVLAEESDSDGQGGYASHFELYRSAMRSCRTDTRVIDAFVDELATSGSVRDALHASGAPAWVQTFVLETFAVVGSNDTAAIASAFTFGREDLLPLVFQRIVDELNVDAEGRLNAFRYYLNRHIELDGDQHGPMSEQLILDICGQNEESWLTAEVVALRALQARKAMWDGTHQAMLAVDAVAAT